MNASEIANLLHGRTNGRGRWHAHCPAHPDQTPSLSIREGYDGRTLLRCWAGCATKAVLLASGLTWGDLFAGSRSPLSSKQQAELDSKREQDECARLRLHWLHAQGYERLHSLQALIDGIAPRLMFMLDSSEAHALTVQFHETLDEVRRLESVLIRIERWF